jgi:eukaryotic-like serine/threonine-protein kinase
MAMVYIPAGDFLMGSTGADVDAALAMCYSCGRDSFLDEQPQHTVYLDAFWIDRTEVTVVQYQKCVEAGVCAVWYPAWDDSGFTAPYQPITDVNWDEAKAYCEWVGARLPTEAEWEKAARGTEGWQYPWGNSVPDCDKVNSKECLGGSPASVGSYAAGASTYGVLDMAGNVREWVNDWYDSAYYAHSPDRNPQGPDSGKDRGLRGGSWGEDAASGVRSADRGWLGPPQLGNTIGFRCALPATPSP